VAITNKQNQVKEIIKCGKDPIYFINRYCKIQHPTQGLLRFDTFDYQDDCIDAFINNRFNIVLKGRQLGISTITAAYATWLALFHRDKQVLIIATKRPTAVNFIKKVKAIISHLPAWLKLSPTVTNNTQMIEFASGSSIKAIPTSDDAGRSEALSLLIVDEAAFIKNFDELWAGLYSTLSEGGNCIIISTPNGVGGQYHKLYTDAELGINDFNPIRLPWYVHPHHDEAWFQKECKQLSKRKIAQELMCDFVASGDTFLSQDHLDWIGHLVKEPIDRWAHDKNLWIWSYPIKEHRYIIAADVARGDGKDFSAFHVIDTTTCDIAAEYKGKLQPDRLAELLNDTGKKYYNALICPENNSFGYATCMKLQEFAYPKLYYQDSKAVHLTDYVPQQTSKTAGFNTNGRTRVQILSKLEEIIRNRQIRIYSSRFYDELKTFVWHGARPQAAKDRNDDLVISLAIGVWLFDASSGYSKYTETLSAGMLAGMGVNSRNFDDIPGTGKEAKTVNPFATPDETLRRTKDQGANPADTSLQGDYELYSWLL